MNIVVLTQCYVAVLRSPVLYRRHMEKWVLTLQVLLVCTWLFGLRYHTPKARYRCPASEDGAILDCHSGRCSRVFASRISSIQHAFQHSLKATGQKWSPRTNTADLIFGGPDDMYKWPFPGPFCVRLICSLTVVPSRNGQSSLLLFWSQQDDFLAWWALFG